jgi:hypothetical protein
MARSSMLRHLEEVYRRLESFASDPALEERQRRDNIAYG